VHDYAWQIIVEKQQPIFEQQLELDTSYQYKDQARFRVNVYTVKGATAISMRLIPMKIASVDDLRLPPFCHQVATMHSGFVLVTGPTGTGKSSTLAAIINEINQTRAEHILTIEDPIEFVYSPIQSIISQREVGHDVLSWTNALRTAMREDPDVVLVGEMRDLETIAAALTVAETGHLVFATLHTNSAPETIDRIIDVFPQGQQPQIRQQLASTLKAVLSQRLVPTADGKGRIAVMETLVSNTAVSNLIREAKTFQIDNVIQTSTEQGMMLLEKHLAQYVTAGVITYDEAIKYAIRPKELERSLGH
jgi:twitching motility protein PilT